MPLLRPDVSWSRWRVSIRQYDTSGLGVVFFRVDLSIKISIPSPLLQEILIFLWHRLCNQFYTRKKWNLRSIYASDMELLFRLASASGPARPRSRTTQSVAAEENEAQRVRAKEEQHSDTFHRSKLKRSYMWLMHKVCQVLWQYHKSYPLSHSPLISSSAGHRALEWLPWQRSATTCREAGNIQVWWNRAQCPPSQA